MPQSGSISKDAGVCPHCIAGRSRFTRAAEDLQIPRATVTTLMQRMEQQLGARLLERTTRTVQLRPDGQAYDHRSLRLLADGEEPESAFRNTSQNGCCDFVWI